METRLARTSADCLLLFGATGDLAQRMLLPSLYGLHGDGLLPKSLSIVGTARSELDGADFRESAAKALERFIDGERLADATVRSFLDRLNYVQLDAGDTEGYARIAQATGGADRLAIFLSTAPSLFRATIAGLAGAGLSGDGVRLALEKPLGADLGSRWEEP